MSEIGFTGYKRRIREYATEHHHTIGDSKISRLASKLSKRQERMNDETLERIFTHSDPTPLQAILNIENRRVTT
ncbi:MULTISPECIES: hypothetical protein [unclassified Arthrobacter]|uniref:hypothetical protein n=1 Tax=unclassified Arthrobacter TaxID=235627 RepID=UPI001490EFC3|nr:MULTISPECIES: hypothetical protein [unclassified Arthrobacter]MBE0009578.1 hypothetical protein [Arthrobacter sp. AET 35A]NOJ63328.1 hypothetical protein [Arthrobacter sp. 147(2020)]